MKYDPRMEKRKKERGESPKGNETNSIANKFDLVLFIASSLVKVCPHTALVVSYIFALLLGRGETPIIKSSP